MKGRERGWGITEGDRDGSEKCAVRVACSGFTFICSTSLPDVSVTE